MGNLSEVLREAIFPQMIVEETLGPASGISESVLAGSVVVGIIVLFCVIVRVFVIPRFKLVPGGFQMFLEWLVTFFDGSAEETAGKRFAKFLGPYTFAAAAYICIGTLIEMVGMRAILSDINTCLALSISTFVMINVCGIKAHGPVGRVKYYFKPMPVIAPIKMLTDLTVPFSMALRLFASVLSGFLIMELLYNVLWLSIGAPAVLSVIFTLFHAFMQAYIFATLSLAFIAEASE